MMRDSNGRPVVVKGKSGFDRKSDAGAPHSTLAFAALDVAAFGGPIEEAFHLVAVFPAQFEELGCGHVGGFGAEVGFEAPAKIGTIPGVEAVALGRQPVVAEKLPHSIGCGGIMA
jgi:hypothetical protein